MNEWDLIAQSFDTTRKQPWKECIDFIEDIDGICLDVACGNGRHLIPLAARCDVAVGIDSSIEMIRISQKHVYENKNDNIFLLCGTACKLPFNENIFDHAIFIAALHNIKGKNNRIIALKELRRVLKPGGTALISVWSKFQDDYRWYFFRQYLRIARNVEHGDIQIPWKKDGVCIDRFYHFYGYRELLQDIASANLSVTRSWNTIISSKKHPDNHFVLVRK